MPTPRKPSTASLPSGGPCAAEIRSALVVHLAHRRFPAGTFLWHEGQTEGQLVLLERGRVQIFRTVQGEREVPIFVFGPGDLFGFMPLLDGSPYPASAVTLDEVDAQVLSRAGLERVLADHPEVTRVLLSALSRRLRGAFAQIEMLSTRGAVSRVAAMMSALVPDDAREPVLIELPVSARALAESLNLTPPTLSRAFGELVGAGVLLKLGPGRYQVLDRLRLRGMSQSPGPIL